MKILRSCVFNHYLDVYFEARKASENYRKRYEESVNAFVETLNMSNVGPKSYWSYQPEEYWKNQKKLANSIEHLKTLRKALAVQTKEAKKVLKLAQHTLSIAQCNLDKAIKIQNGITNKNAYNLLDTEDIEKENYYNLAALPIYPTDNVSGFNLTVLKQQQDLMKKEV